MRIAQLLTKPRMSAVTGGHIYNDDLYDQIERNLNIKMDLLHDELFKVNRKSFFRVLSYVANFRKIKEYDVVFAGSDNIRMLFIIKRLKRYGIKAIIIHHHYEYQTYPKYNIKHYIFKIVERYLLKHAYKVIFANKYTIDFAYDVLGDCRHNSRFIEISAELPHREINEVEKSHNIVFVGTVIKRKGIHLLLESLKLLNCKNYIIQIVGKYDKNKYYYSLLKKIRKYGLQNRVQFIGRASQCELNEIYKNARFFAFPSLNEGYGLVIVEAMSFGLPVVAFDNTAMPYNVRNNENGFLVENRNVKEFAHKMDTLLMNDEKLKELSLGAYSIYDHLHSKMDFNEDVKAFTYELVEDVSRS